MGWKYKLGDTILFDGFLFSQWLFHYHPVTQVSLIEKLSIVIY